MWNPPHRFWVRSLVAALAAWVAEPPVARAVLDLGVAFSFSAPAPALNGEFEGIAFGTDSVMDQPAIFSARATSARSPARSTSTWRVRAAGRLRGAS